MKIKEEIEKLFAEIDETDQTIMGLLSDLTSILLCLDWTKRNFRRLLPRNRKKLSMQMKCCKI